MTYLLSRHQQLAALVRTHQQREEFHGMRRLLLNLEMIEKQAVFGLCSINSLLESIDDKVIFAFEQKRGARPCGTRTPIGVASRGASAPACNVRFSSGPTFGSARFRKENGGGRQMVATARRDSLAPNSPPFQAQLWQLMPNNSPRLDFA
jgi:hypothetical protein